MNDLSTLFEPYVWSWFEETFQKPSPPQTAAWPTIAEGKNTLIFSPTGSGKTLAAFLWCINELFRMGHEQTLEDSVYVLYISPLKALNNDIQRNLVEPLAGIKAYARDAGLDVPDVRSAVRTGDTTQKQRAAMTRKPPHILITTPESLYIILATEKFREAFRTVRYVIVDEIHAMSDNKRGVHLSLSLERLAHLVANQRMATCGCTESANQRIIQPYAPRPTTHNPQPAFVRIGLSATQRPLETIADFLVGVDDDGKPRPCEIVDVGARKDLDVRVISPVDNLLEAHFDAIWGSAYDQMLSMIRDHETTLIFTNSRYKTERSALRLNELAADSHLRVGAHHGSMSKRVRLAMERKLKRGDLDALVATSSLELGIDVGSIDLVCQIQSPKSVSSGMQRIGRAGHLLNATSKGRLLVTDRDDLVESAVLVRAILDGQIDTTRVPANCLDVLAQHIVGAVAADLWDTDALFALFRHAYCYRDLDRADYDRVLDMLSGNYEFKMEYAPYPKISWDKVNNLLYPEPGARMIAFRAGGTIPDISDYDVYFEAKKTVVGRLGEGFVEELHVGDIFILGSSSWRVLAIRKNRVVVDDVYGKAPTIPFWFGDRASRTYDLGLMVGAFREEMARRLSRHSERNEAKRSEVEQSMAVGRGDPSTPFHAPTSLAIAQDNVIEWLQAQYHVNGDGARAIVEYFREQQHVTNTVPSNKHILIENFRDELGQQQLVIHASFGIRVLDPWAMVLAQAIEERHGFRPTVATVDDGILVTIPDDAVEAGLVPAPGPPQGWPLQLITPENLGELLHRAVMDSPVFKSRFRHNAVRSMLVLREYKGRRTPVWLQGLRASALLDACRDYEDFPLITETMRECLNESLDVPNLHKVIAALAAGEIQIEVVESEIPSPFTHSLLLLGQYGDLGSTSTQERRSRLMHLHRELLRQILDEETLRHLLDEDVVREVEARLQRRYPKRARNANELARLLLDLGDLVDAPDDEISLLDRVERDRVDGDVDALLDDVTESRRAVRVPIPTAETHVDRWIATENFPLYRDAFATQITVDDDDAHLLEYLVRDGPVPLADIPLDGDVDARLNRLVRAYRVLQVVRDWRPAYVATEAWIPEHITQPEQSREEARLALVHKFARWHGPFTKYEIMERYGFPERWVESALATLHSHGDLVKGEYVPTKSFPQWCYRPNLEEIHRLTLNRLRKEMEPASPSVYADFLIRWQHRHPETQLEGIDGVREVIRQIQGQENYQIVFERDIFHRRVKDYDPAMLDRLCYSGEVLWRRLDPKHLKRGQIAFCLRWDQAWLAPHPADVNINYSYNNLQDDIPEVTDALRDYLRGHGACFFDDIVKDTGLDWRLVLRSIWRLVWTGEATNDSYESIRYADVASGLSACYDLATHPGKKGVTLDFIVKHILENRQLNPRLGRWSPTERLLVNGGAAALDEEDREYIVAQWAGQLLLRYGIVTKEMLKNEVAALKWGEVRKALVKMELLGQARCGYFVEGLSGEQYATPEAVEALRQAKLRQPSLNGSNGLNGKRDEESAASVQSVEDDLVCLNMFDSANPYGFLFPLTDVLGNPVRTMRTPTQYVVLQNGRPVMLWRGAITVLADLSRDTAEAAIRSLMELMDHRLPFDSRREIAIRNWNSHPVDVSPARHLLLALGFQLVDNRWRGCVYDGETKPDAEIVAVAEKEIPGVFEFSGKEEAPVVYDAEWIISRAEKAVRPKLRELIGWFQKRLPPECEFIYHAWYGSDFMIRYRGMRCINPHIQRQKINLHITHRGWVRPIEIMPDTDLDAPEFEGKVFAQFNRSKKAVDELLDKT